MKTENTIVIGGANVDICGQSFAPLIPGDSNPGFSRISLGGVGRNIAHNLSLLGVHVSLITALGQDAHAKLVEDSCRSLSIDLTHSLRVREGRTSTYIFLNGPDADMALAVSDMGICDELVPSFLEEKSGFLKEADVIIADANIPETSLIWLAEHCSRPLFVDPVSVTKAEKLRRCLGHIHTLKPNLLEAQSLSGIEIHSEEDLRRAAVVLLDTGLKRVFISMGRRGVFYADQHESGIVPVIRTQVRNATGAGDAFMSGLVWSYLHGMGLRDSAVYATAASSIAIEGAETINPDMSAALLKNKAKQLEEGENL